MRSDLTNGRHFIKEKNEDSLSLTERIYQILRKFEDERLSYIKLQQSQNQFKAITGKTIINPEEFKPR